MKKYSGKAIVDGMSEVFNIVDRYPNIGYYVEIESYLKLLFANDQLEIIELYKSYEFPLTEDECMELVEFIEANSEYAEFDYTRCLREFMELNNVRLK